MEENLLFEELESVLEDEDEELDSILEEDGSEEMSIDLEPGDTRVPPEEDPTVPPHVKNITLEEKKLWNEHPTNNEVHVTAEDKKNWNGKQDAGDYALKKDIPTKVGQLLNDVGYLNKHQDVSMFITKLVEDLEHYYTKKETYTKEEVNDIISKIKTSSFDVVDKLPTEDIQENVIYLVPSEVSEENNTYSEYLYLKGKWELIGTLQSTINIEDLKKAIDDHISNQDIHVNSTLKDTWNKHVSNEEVHVTDTDKDRWNKKSDFSGNYSDLNGLPSIPDPYELPIASNNVLGGIKVGEKLKITPEGVLSGNETPLYIGTEESPINLNDKEIVEQPFVYIQGEIKNGPSIGFTNTKRLLCNIYDKYYGITGNICKYTTQVILTGYNDYSSVFSPIQCYTRTLYWYEPSKGYYVKGNLNWNSVAINLPKSQYYKTTGSISQSVYSSIFTQLGAYNLYKELINSVGQNGNNLDLLSNLNTEDKTSLVNAINEVNSKIGNINTELATLTEVSE